MGAKKRATQGTPQPKKDNAPQLDLVAKPIQMSSENVEKNLEVYSEIQQNEFIALNAIYPEGFKRIHGRTNPWKKVENLAFQIRVAPYGQTDYAAVLNVEFPSDYPKILPVVDLVQITPDLSDLRHTFQSIITTRLNEHKDHPQDGSISLIADDINNFLNELEARRAETKVDWSLEEERAAKELALRKQSSLDRERAEQIQAEETIKKEMDLANEVETVRQRRLESSRLQRQKTEDDNVEKPVTVVRFDQPMKCRDVANDRVLAFKSVAGETVILRRKDKRVTIASPLVDDNEAQAPQLLLKDVFLPESLATKEQLYNIMKKIEEDLEGSKKHRQQNIVDLLGYKLERVDLTDGSGEWRLAILSEYANKGSLTDILRLTEKLPAPKIRDWTHQLLDALDFLDRLGYVHPAVHSNNVLIFLSKRGGVSVKLSDGYGTALRTLVMQARSSFHIVDAEYPMWTAPELNGPGVCRVDKTCVWELGVVILQMALSLEVKTQYSSPVNCMEGVDFDDDFQELLDSIFQSNPDRRLTAHKLKNMVFFRRKHDKVFRNPTDLSEVLATRPNQPTFPDSRWETDWVELERQGKGGFGQVVKAQNKFDGQYYAVKKIKTKSARELTDLIEEVKLLARLSHPYVVRYYQSWNEPVRDPHQIEVSKAKPVANRKKRSHVPAMKNTSTLPSTGLDFMEPSVRPNIGPEFGHSDPFDDYDDDQNVGIDTNELDIVFDDDNDDDETDSNPFAYQSAPATDQSEDEDDEEEQARAQAVMVDITDPKTYFDKHKPQPVPRRQSTTEEEQTETDDHHSTEVQPAQKQILYIQMEYCENRDLRRLLGNDFAQNVNQVWQLFRNIVEGLAHIHQQGVVHRDLKPENIFIDGSDTPKIGDFGLATTGIIPWSNKQQADNTVGPESKGIGTYYYVAPELRSEGSGSYNFKADMYSLGIMFFEMCYPMATYGERNKQLNRLIESDHELPPLFDNEAYAAQSEIILNLIDHDPTHRPSARELLDGGLIPEALEEVKMQRYFERLSWEHPAAYRELIERQLDKTNNPAQDRAWEEQTQPITPQNQLDLLLTASVNNKLKAIFSRHQAVEGQRDRLIPKEVFYSNNAKFVDASGLVVQLPFDLTLPFARSIACQVPPFAKNYCFGTVYRRNDIGAEPKRGPEVDFDIVSEKASDMALKEAEIIKVMDEIVTGFQSLSPKKWVILLNHSDLLDMILHTCQIEEKDHGTVKRALSELNITATWEKVRAELRSTQNNIPETCLTELAKFNVNGTVEKVQTRFVELASKNPEFQRATIILLKRMDEIITFSKRYGVQTAIRIAPLSNNSEQLYSGSVMFQCVDVKTRRVLAAGGRYDALINKHQQATHKKIIRAAGFRLNSAILVSYERDFLAQAFSAKGAKSAKERATIMPSRCEVVVTSFDSQTLVTSCLEVVQDLWSAGLAAELSEEFDSMESLERAYKSSGSCWFVLLKARHSYEGETRVKVRSPTREERDITQSELIPLLRAELADRHITAENPAVRHRKSLGNRDNFITLLDFFGDHSLTNLVPTSSPESMTHERANADIVILTPEHRAKKVNRAAIIDLATSATKEVAESYSNNAPIIAIDTSNELMQLIRTTRLGDGELWRALKEKAPTQERKYLEEVCSMLKAKADQGVSGVFVYNYKSKICIFHPLW